MTVISTFYVGNKTLFNHVPTTWNQFCSKSDRNRALMYDRDYTLRDEKKGVKRRKKRGRNREMERKRNV